MNVMFIENGRRLRTPPLTDTILNGVTRASLLEIAKDLGLETSEDPITIDEVVAGIKSGSIGEAFACGTAAVVVGIRTLHFEDGETLKVGGHCPGTLTEKLYEALVAVQFGRVPDTRGWIQEVCQTEMQSA